MTVMSPEHTLWRCLGCHWDWTQCSSSSGGGAGSILLLTALAIAGPALRVSSRKVEIEEGSLTAKTYIHMTGHDCLKWVHLKVSCLRDATGSNTHSCIEPVRGMKTGGPIGFFCMDCKWMTKPYFSVWLVWLLLLLEAATLLFKKWTNLWRQRNKMNLANYVLCQRNDQLGFGKRWL